jgi:4-amino-4-deoxy-L-arabinose transferase-like glycosyltransferase
MKDWQAFCLLAVILVIGLALIMQLFSGPDIVYDDGGYIQFVHQIFQGDFIPQTYIESYSLGFIYVLSLFFGTFGFNLTASVLPGITEYLLLVVATFVTGRKLGGNSVAVLAAVFAATSPTVVGYATRILPDTLLGLCVALAVLVLLYAIDTKKDYLFLVSGLITGFAVSVRLDGFLFVFFYTLALFAALWLRKDDEHKRMFAYFAVGVVIALAGFFYAFWAYTGNPISGVVQFQKILPNALSTLPNNIGMALALISPVPPANFQYVRPVEQYSLGPVILLSLTGSAISLYKKDKFWVLATISLGVFLYYVFGTYSLFAYSPIVLVDRFFAMILMPISILAAYTVLAVYESLKKKSRAYAAIAVLVLVSSSLFYSVPAYSVLYQLNNQIKGQWVVYYSAVSYLATALRGENVSLYMWGDNVDLQATLIRFFITKNQSIDALPLYSIPCNPPKNAFILMTAQPNIFVIVNKSLSSMIYRAEENCSVSVSQIEVFNSSGVTGTLYRITGGQ